MEFKSLKNIETSFRQIRLFCIVLVIGCAVVAICSVVFAFRFAEKQREKIYVLDGGKSLMLALSQDRLTVSEMLAYLYEEQSSEEAFIKEIARICETYHLNNQ